MPPAAIKHPAWTPHQRLVRLDTWRRSGRPAGAFAALVGLSKHTLDAWQKKLDPDGPAGLLDQPRGGPTGSQLPDRTRRTIRLLKQAHPAWGCQRIRARLVRGPALPASPGAVARVRHEAGSALAEVTTRPPPDHVRSLERAAPNPVGPTDRFRCVRKRPNRRVYRVAFRDDHRRLVVSEGLHASQSTALVLEVLRAGLTNDGAPQEMLTDNGSPYVTGRGPSALVRALAKRGIHQIVAAPRRPQTLGQSERLGGTRWPECLARAVFLDLGAAPRRIGLFIDDDNFQRPHQGIGGRVPADGFFGAAPEVVQTLKARVAANALERARHGLPKAPFDRTGPVGGQPFRVPAAGERVIRTGAEGRRAVELVSPAPAPGAPAPARPEPVGPAGVVGGAWAEAAGAVPPAVPGTPSAEGGGA